MRTGIRLLGSRLHVAYVVEARHLVGAWHSVDGLDDDVDDVEFMEKFAGLEYPLMDVPGEYDRERLRAYGVYYAAVARRRFIFIYPRKA